jgi:hypothetical protein
MYILTWGSNTNPRLVVKGEVITMHILRPTEVKVKISLV